MANVSVGARQDAAKVILFLPSSSVWVSIAPYSSGSLISFAS
jgi:hypothetical protein